MQPKTREFYRHVMERLRAEGIPFMIGGAYALQQYTGVCRHTKDIDLFVRPTDRERVLAALDAAGYETELTSPVWIAKARCGDDFVDVIFSSGNAMAEVDDAWFEQGTDGEVLGVPVRLCPPEEMIWSKAYIMERERYDGADIAHLLRARGRTIDWKRLLARLDAELDAARADEPACQGTLLSRYQYRIDIDEWGYRDGRVRPTGRMTSGQAKAMDREPREA